MSIPVVEDAPAEKPKVKTRSCKHCGSPSFAEEFCCTGCAYVHRLINEGGYTEYYAFKDAITSPADVALTPERDHSWLAAAQLIAEARGSDAVAETSVAIQGISCVGCVWLIERLYERQPGAGRIEINVQTGRATLRWIKGKFDAPAFARELQRFNYLLGPAHTTKPGPSESQRLAKRIGLCAAFAMNVMLFTLPSYFGMESTARYSGLFTTLSMVFASLSLLAGGGYFLGRAFHALRERALHIDLPIAVGICGAYLGSFAGWIGGREEYLYFDFVSAFIVLMLIGRWAQIAAVERNQRRLLKDQPTAPHVRRVNADGSTTSVASESLEKDDAYLLAPGEMLPVESRLDDDTVKCGLSWINGESDPRDFRRGQSIPAGAQNLSNHPILLTARQAWADSLLAKLLKPVERATYRHRLVERVIEGYLIAIIGIAAMAGIGWYIGTGDVVHAGAVVTAVLVVSCPCALGLAFPLTDEIATVALRKYAVFIRSADLWPRLNKITRVVFDKTGTLTLETPSLTNPEILDRLPEEAREALHTMVSDSPHPVSRCIHGELLARGLAYGTPPTEAVVERIGYGLELGSWRLGRATWAAPAIPSDGERGTVLAKDGKVIARFLCKDATREDAREEVDALRKRDLDVYILSGDHEAKVQTLATKLGIQKDRALSACSPVDKANWIEANDAGSILMLGDGANDSLAFDHAFCRGTPLVHRGTLENRSDFYYLGRGIRGIRALFEVNAARSRTQLALLVFMISYNCVAVGLSVSGHMNPLLAAILMPVSSLVTLAIVGLGMKSVRGPAR